jgi:hypothetical protein
MESIIVHTHPLNLSLSLSHSQSDTVMKTKHYFTHYKLTHSLTHFLLLGICLPPYYEELLLFVAKVIERNKECKQMLRHIYYCSTKSLVTRVKRMELEL